jgi:hypothetical protein
MVKISADETEVLKKYNAGKTFVKGYEREKHILQKLGENQELVKLGVIPRLIRYHDKRRELLLSHCGNPLTPSTIPGGCKRKVMMLSEMLNVAKVVHGDACSHNFLLNKSGEICLVDFGRAKEMKSGEMRASSATSLLLPSRALLMLYLVRRSRNYSPAECEANQTIQAIGRNTVRTRTAASILCQRMGSVAQSIHHTANAAHSTCSMQQKSGTCDSKRNIRQLVSPTIQGHQGSGLRSPRPQPQPFAL